MPTNKNGTKLGRHGSLWRDEFILLAYEHAKQGLTDSSIAKALGVGFNSFESYKKKHPLLVTALKRGRKLRSGTEGSTYREYIYKVMPQHLRELLDKIESVRDEPNGIRRMEAMLESEGLYARQHLFLHAFEASAFNMSEACRVVNISKRTLDSWLRLYPEFSELMQEMRWHWKNFLEGSLFKLVKEGDVGATIFANKTQNADRGYGDTKKLDVNVQGQINHAVGIIKVDELQLDLNTRKELLAAMRRQKAVGGPNVIESKPKANIAAGDSQ